MRQLLGVLETYRLALLVVIGLATVAVLQNDPWRQQVLPAAAAYSSTSAPRPPRNCTEVSAKGRENIPRGSPYYAPWLDADNDGLACEPWHGRR
jgi:Excalibur calcium-binding domain